MGREDNGRKGKGSGREWKCKGREGQGRAGMGKGSLEKMERSKQIPISIESFG